VRSAAAKSMPGSRWGRRGLRRLGLAAGACLSAAAASRALAMGGAAAAPPPAPCPRPLLPPSYGSRVERALGSKTDLWGNALLRSPAGPTYAAARRYLEPLMLAGHVPGRRSEPLTDSGVYYLPFTGPVSVQGPAQVALHLADGSELVSQSVSGPRLSIGVGPDGRELYGSCLARLATPSLLDGYLPVLETDYVDADGVRFRQESFAARIPQTGTLVSFVRLTAEPGRASAPIVIRLTPSAKGLRFENDALVSRGEMHLITSAGASWNGTSVSWTLPAARTSTVYAAWLVRPSPALPIALDAATYLAARNSIASFWRGRLSSGASLLVPERTVLDAERACLILDMELTWRYSIGNAYQELEYPESLDATSVIGEYGFGAVERSTLETTLAQRPALYPDWEMGAKLLTSADYYDLYRDRAYIAAATPVLSGYVSDLARQVAQNPLGILHRERWTSDLPETAYALDSQAVVWQALGAMARVWSATGDTTAARMAGALAARLGTALRAAVKQSERRLPDGSLFIPIKLYAHEKPTGAVLETRDGSYWNYEIPYALASGLFTFGGRQADEALRYMLDHGSFLLGQVRINAYSLYESPTYPTSGTDDVYMLELARFLADEEQPNRLVLSLYGLLAAGMTPGTFVSGEAASVAPLPGEYFRSMYLPPNSVAAAAFIETLRLTLVHEVDSAAGAPRGLELAFSTPRLWLAAGKTIMVSRVPTSFGSLSYTLRAVPGAIDATVTAPGSAALRSLRLRLRLPNDRPLLGVRLDGRPYTRFDGRSETVDLSGLHGTLNLVVRT
jgi:hypothetical protein